MKPTPKLSPLHTRLLAIVAGIPSGWVMSYGSVARAAGLPRHARHVAVALKAAPTEREIPWWRVVNSEGRISPRGLDGSDDLQRILLEAEGIIFDASGRVDLARFGWGG
ncbi:MGMT family protein [Parachitinimonas caeni]|uniref:MGMT family protein n=1 Tax=Parachitinimonas caeni TaxID=3031301 RepID=A0ABT7DS68_9NEIS|nr:MGMT family protein [Parachitinimonas caeni]MDK2122915.1 MGMT family protein [Parachitinimonas caeni]